LTTRHKRPMKSLLLGQGAEVCDPSFNARERFRLSRTLCSISRMEETETTSSTRTGIVTRPQERDHAGAHEVCRKDQAKAYTRNIKKDYGDMTNGDLDVQGSRSRKILVARLRSRSLPFRRMSRLMRKGYRKVGRASGMRYGDME